MDYFPPMTLGIFWKHWFIDFCLHNSFWLSTCHTFCSWLNFSLKDQYMTVKHLIKFSPNLYSGLDRVCDFYLLEGTVGKTHPETPIVYSLFILSTKLRIYIL